MSGNVTLYTAEALCVRRNVVTDKVIPITDTHGIFTALMHLESEQLTKEKIQPALPQQPLGFVSKAVLDKYIRDAADIKELVLSKDYKLVKEYTTQRPGGSGACSMCVWKEFIRAALAHSSRHELRTEEKEIVDRVTDAYAEILVRTGKSEGVDLSKLLEYTPTTRDESMVYEKFFDAQCNSSS